LSAFLQFIFFSSTIGQHPIFFNTLRRSQFRVLLINVKQFLMTLQKTFLAYIACGLLFSSCSQNYNISSFSGETPAEILPPDSTRMLIKTAELKLRVEDVQQTIIKIQQAVNSMDGHVMHYEINANRAHKQEVAYSLDSSYLVDEIHPEGLMKIRIPVGASDSFIHTMLTIESSIDKLLFDEEDITEELNERRELSMIIPHEKKSQDTCTTNLNIFAIQRKSEYVKGKYLTQFLWFDISLQGNSYIEKKKTAGDHQIHDSIFVNLIRAFETGWFAFAVFFTTVISAWPFLIILMIILIGLKRKWLHRLRPTSVPVK